MKLLNTHCYICHRRNPADFWAPTEVWGKICVDKSEREKVLCYDCFCDQCQIYDFDTIWLLEEMNKYKTLPSRYHRNNN